jgi:hypothetical protein
MLNQHDINAARKRRPDAYPKTYRDAAEEANNDSIGFIGSADDRKRALSQCSGLNQ